MKNNTGVAPARLKSPANGENVSGRAAPYTVEKAAGGIAHGRPGIPVIVGHAALANGEYIFG
jgi:hypothetical protein